MNSKMTALAAAILVIWVFWFSYNYKTNKLAELEYKQEVKDAQQEIIDNYGKAEKEIKDRHHEQVKWNEDVKNKVNKELENAEDGKPYTLAIDNNSTK